MLALVTRYRVFACGLVKHNYALSTGLEGYAGRSGGGGGGWRRDRG